MKVGAGVVDCFNSNRTGRHGNGMATKPMIECEAMTPSHPVFRADEPAPNDLLVKGRAASASPKRSVILAATRHIIGNAGCNHVKMRLVAERSEVSPPTVYALVGSRHDVLHSALQEGLQVKFAIAERRAQLEQINPCVAFAATKLDAISANESFYRQIDRGARLSMLDVSTVRAIHDTIERQFHTWLHQMQRDAQLQLPRSMPLSTIAKTLAHQLNLPVRGWAAGEYGLSTLRSDLLSAITLPLFAITTEAEHACMNRWLDQHA